MSDASRRGSSSRFFGIHEPPEVWRNLHGNGSRNLAGISVRIPPPNRSILRNPEESRAGFRLELFFNSQSPILVDASHTHARTVLKQRKPRFLEIHRDYPPSKSRNLAGIPGGISPPSRPVFRNLEEPRASFRPEFFPGRNLASKTLRWSLYMRTCARTVLVRARARTRRGGGFNPKKMKIHFKNLEIIS